MNKKGWSSKDFLLATLIFSAVVALFIIMVSAISEDYNNPEIIDPNFSNSFDKLDENTAQVKEMWDNTKDGLNFLDASELIFSGTLKVISLLFKSVISAGSQMSNMAVFMGDSFGLPVEISRLFFGLLVAGLTVVIIFTVLNSVRGSQQL